MNNDMENMWNEFYTMAKLAGMHPTIVAQYRMVFFTGAGMMHRKFELARRMLTPSMVTPKQAQWANELNAIHTELQRQK